MRLRVLSINIHKGFDWRGQSRIHELRNAILSVEPDIVFLQEVHGKHLVENFELETLADEIWHDHSYAQNSINSGGDYGNAILSRYPIISSEFYDLSTNKLEKRNIQNAIIDIEGNILSCFNTHLNILRSSRRKQLEEIRCYLNQKKLQYAILAGDFNDLWQDSRELEKAIGFADSHYTIYGEYAKSFPSPIPFLRLDRLMTKGLEVNECKLLNDRIWKRLSDHLPIFCEIILSDNEISSRS